MIESQFLKLHFSQLVNAWKLSRYNTYSNVQKQIYHEHLAGQSENPVGMLNLRCQFA